jgi:hypothetical protein
LRRTRATNNSGSATQNITSLPNGTNAIFSQTFDLSGTITAATVSVLADDTTSVVVNGVTVDAAALGGSYPTCSSVQIGCLTNTEGTLNIAPYLVDGSNTISFDVYQENGSSYGLDYAGSVTTTPEPGLLVMLSSGLLGLGFMQRRKLG